jgi:hypothetical protein
MNGRKTVVAVAPGCSAELVLELLGAGVLPGPGPVDVLLPNGGTGLPDLLLKKAALPQTTRILASPGKYFFSPHHLYWLWENLWTSTDNLLLVADSPYQDPLTALIVLTVLALSGKSITLLFATPEAMIDLTGEGFSGRWLTQELDVKVLVSELGRLFWFFKPLYILYFFMFGGLIAKKTAADFFSSRRVKSRSKPPDSLSPP